MTTRTFAAAVGTPIAALALIAALSDPSLFLYYAGVAWFLFGAGGIASALMQGGRVVELEKRLGESEDDVKDLTAALAESTAAQAAAGVPLRLRSVGGNVRPFPRQRRSPDAEWNDLARAIEDETGGAS